MAGDALSKVIYVLDLCTLLKCYFLFRSKIDYSRIIFPGDEKLHLYLQNLEKTWKTIPRRFLTGVYSASVNIPGFRPMDYRLVSWNAKPASKSADSHLSAVLIRRLQKSETCQDLQFKIWRDQSEHEESLTHSTEACPKMEESAPIQVASNLHPAALEPGQPQTFCPGPGEPARGSLPTSFHT